MPNQLISLCGYLLLLGVGFACPRAAAVTEVCVGEPVDLAGQSWTAVDRGAGHEVRDLREIATGNYTILGTASESFAATLMPLVPDGEDVSRSRSMRFFFHRAGHYSVTATGDDGYQFQTEYRVSIPTADVTSRTIAEVTLYNWGSQPTLGFGDQDTNGLTLEFDIAMGRCSGTISDVQTLSFIDIDGMKNGSINLYDTAGDFVLDFDPEFYDTWQFGFNISKHTGDRFGQRYADLPRTPLFEDRICASSDADFRYYLLYKADAPGAIWVPFAEFDWQLTMHVSRPNSKTPWLGGEGVNYSGRAVVPEDFAATVEHWPTWTRNWTEVEMISLDDDCSLRPRTQRQASRQMGPE